MTPEEVSKSLYEALIRLDAAYALIFHKGYPPSAAQVNAREAIAQYEQLVGLRKE